jgi:predicted Zn-dependent protease
LIGSIMQDQFFTLADIIGARLKGDEGFLASFSGEASQFVRYNRSAVRQAGAVEQRYLTVELFSGRRHAAQVVTLTGEQADDTERVTSAVTALRDVLADAPEDPLFLINTAPQSTSRVLPDRLAKPEDMVDAVLRAGAGHDLVGFSAAGPIHRGFANSFGQRNWDTAHAFNIDLCFYLQADKAVKMDHAGTVWDGAAFAAKAATAKAQLAALARPSKTIGPGAYRVYLAPAAMEEVMGMLSWGGFSLAEHRTATTPLLKMVEQGVVLNRAVTIMENSRDGLAPGFQNEGFVKPDTVTLIGDGVYKDCMASPRSAAEFGVPQNGADENYEAPLSLDMRAGTLPQADVLKTIGTGIFIGNLWYLNYSDRNACRLTGMTRFATFWVESGEIVAPLNVMRFDDTVYRMLGDNLVGLTAERDLRLATDTYEARSTRSMHLPGAVIDDVRMTL